MISATDKARYFRSLHVPHDPLILYNIWDAGSALAVARAGAKALATGSWSVAAAQGYADGEELPLADSLAVVARILACTDLPVTADFESGYAADPAMVGQNVQSLLKLGVVGLNFEDQVVGGPGLYGIADQVARLHAVRKAADDLGVSVFLNARTDVFLKAEVNVAPESLLEEALAREAAYAEAGADGFFVPGLTDKALIRQICDRATLPVNVMTKGDAQEVRDLAKQGVSRISFGPAPYIALSATLTREAGAYF